MMSIYKIPGVRDLPTLAVMLDDLGRPHPATVAKALEVDIKTVRRWQKAGTAPRTVLLSLYWITRWGLSHLDADLFNAAQAYRQLSEAQGREIARLAASLATSESALAVTRGGALLAHGLPFNNVVDIASRRSSMRLSDTSTASNRPYMVKAVADHPSAVPSTVTPMVRNASLITEPCAQA